MATVICLWCETSLKLGTTTCPECGLQSPGSDSHGGSRKAIRRGRWLVLTIVAIPLMMSAAYAAHGGGLPMISDEQASPAAVQIGTLPAQTAPYSDPLQRSVWIDGVKAVQQALAQPSYANFSGSYINVAAGHVVSFCGELAGTSGYGSASGARRFISVFGQVQATMLETNDGSFGVLWTRVCSPTESPV